VKAPGHELFQRLKDVFGKLPIIAEDLGLITPEVDELRERFGMPGMRILQFGFSDRGAHLVSAARVVPNTVVYTGTHDNNTMLGWWRDGATAVERAHVQNLPGADRARRGHRGGNDPRGGRLCGEPVHLPHAGHPASGSEARMNVPAAGEGNWTWRYPKDALRPDYTVKLAALMEMTDRDGYVAPTPDPPAAGA